MSRDESKGVRGRRKGRGKKEKKGFVFSVLPLKSALAGLQVSLRVSQTCCLLVEEGP